MGIHRVVAVLGLLGVSGATFASCPGSPISKCIFGTAITKLAAATPEACCRACGSNAQCNGWQFGTDCKFCNRKKPCVLKKGAVAPYEGNCTSGVLSRPFTRLAFSDVIGEGAVLQHSQPAAVWGTGATSGETVTVSVANTSITSVANSAGNWTTTLAPQPVSRNVTLTAATTNGDAVSVIISFGVVVLCSGQSNMAMPVSASKPGAFQADNGTAEVAASWRYSGFISLLRLTGSRFDHDAAVWTGVTPQALTRFSAVCWYTGKTLFEKLGSDTPLGLVAAAVGGSPIEYWLPPGPKPNVNACERDTNPTQCDTQYPDSAFFNDIITQLVPYTLGAIVWDQAERDVKCSSSVKAYSCMQRLLTSSWRQVFASPNAPFVAIQLPGYTAAWSNGTGSYPSLMVAGPEVFAMRLQQDRGTTLGGLPNASFVVTYDQSCSAGLKTCPFGSVHNVQKNVIGHRAGGMLHRLLVGGTGVVEGPRPATASIKPTDVQPLDSETARSMFVVSVNFSGGTAPFVSRGTKNCTTCCDASSGARTLDFGATFDGTTWVNSSFVEVSDGVSVNFKVAMQAAPTAVRYTGGATFPQCALYNQEGFPAIPFELSVKGR